MIIGDDLIASSPITTASAVTATPAIASATKLVHYRRPSFLNVRHRRLIPFLPLITRATFNGALVQVSTKVQVKI